MISSATAKVLFFIALSFGPKDATGIFATSNSDNYAWRGQAGNWYLKTKGLPSEDWCAKGRQPTSKRDGDMSVMGYHRDGANTSLDLRSGNRVVKQGDAVFYIVDPGAANEKVFTILYSTK